MNLGTSGRVAVITGGDSGMGLVSPAVIATPMTDAMMRNRAKEQGASFDEALKSFLATERPTLER